MNNGVSLVHKIPVSLIACLSKGTDKDIDHMEAFNFLVEWEMYTTLEPNMDITEASINQNIAFQKIELFLKRYVNGAIWYDEEGMNCVQSHFSSTQNPLFITPVANVTYVTNCLFAKFNAFCSRSVRVSSITVTDLESGIEYKTSSTSGSIDDVATLPVQDQWMGDLSIHDIPWWHRDDVSAYDNRAESVEEQAELKKRLSDNHELLNEEWTLIEKEVRNFIDPDSSEGEIINLEDFKKTKKKWKPKLV